ncbi:hypothetical protein HMPREF0731_2731, partial [Pseudoroseomonas cervicalis ATCC 49957]
SCSRAGATRRRCATPWRRAARRRTGRGMPRCARWRAGPAGR